MNQTNIRCFGFFHSGQNKTDLRKTMPNLKKKST